MVKAGRGLLVKLSLVFFIFALITLAVSGVSMFFNEKKMQVSFMEERGQNIIAHFSQLMRSEGEDFINYQNYLIENADRININVDFNGDYLPEEREYERLFAEHHPGKTLGIDIRFDELDDEVKTAFVIYKHEYWLNLFEQASNEFGIEYLYYVVPTGEPEHMYYMMDVVREERKDVSGSNGEKYINLCIDVLQEKDTHSLMWEAWDSGMKPNGHDRFDNEYGKVYSVYAPLFINDQKLGVICLDFATDVVDTWIINATGSTLFAVGVVLVFFTLLLLLYIHKRYLKKLENLANSVATYSKTKDTGVVAEIENDVKGADEIAALSMQTAAMILELDNYMKNLVETTRELSDTKKQASTLTDMSTRDTLTGIRNKSAFDVEERQLDLRIEEGFKEFGIAIADLNYLKRINDTYGYEKGNEAIKCLCAVLCRIFVHSPVFRTGGDEFVVVLENGDLAKIDSLMKEFEEKLESFKDDPSLEPWEKISAAMGFVRFVPGEDRNTQDVLKRADKAMYTRKKEMKMQ